MRADSVRFGQVYAVLSSYGEKVNGRWLADSLTQAGTPAVNGHRGWSHYVYTNEGDNALDLYQAQRQRFRPLETQAGINPDDEAVGVTRKQLKKLMAAFRAACRPDGELREIVRRLRTLERQPKAIILSPAIRDTATGEADPSALDSRPAKQTLTWDDELMSPEDAEVAQDLLLGMLQAEGKETGAFQGLTLPLQ